MTTFGFDRSAPVPNPVEKWKIFSRACENYSIDPEEFLDLCNSGAAEFKYEHEVYAKLYMLMPLAKGL